MSAPSSLPIEQSDDTYSRELIWAFLFSILVHILVMQMVPWLEKYKPKPALTIEASLVTLPQPQEAPQSPEPTPPQPEVVKPEPKPVVNKPTPIKTSPDKPVPVLSTEQVTETNAYEVPQAAETAPVNTSTNTEKQESSQTSTTSATINKAETTTNASVADAWDDSLYDAYGRNLQKQCERNKQYPAIAVRRSLEGSGVVLVKFNTGGKLQSITIEQSSGQKSLDDQAITMVRKSLSDLPLPSELKGRDFKISVPFEFKLE